MSLPALASDPAAQLNFDFLAGLVRSGNGSPNGVVIARPGVLYLRQDGGTSTTLYVKETGTGPTGWVAK